MVLACPAWAQTTLPTLSCQSPTSLLNTGIAQPVPPATSGTKLGLYAADPIWSQFQELTTTPLQPPSNAAAWTPARTAGTLASAWSTFADAQWLSPGFSSTTGELNQSSPGNWWPRPTPSPVPFYNHYRIQFNLAPEVPPSVVALDLEYMGDDSVVAAFVNGTQQLPFTPAGFTGGIHTNFNSGWVSGTNTLVFSTSDTGWAAGFLARAHLSGQAICSSSPISITKTADQTHYEPGQLATYTVTLTSLGLVDATGVSLADPIPAGLSNPVWACSATGSAVCPSPAGPMPQTFDMPGNSSLSFTLSGTVTGRATLDNIATLTPGTGGVCAATTGCTASVAPTYSPAPAPAPSNHAVPSLTPLSLTVLAAALGLLGWKRRRTL